MKLSEMSKEELEQMSYTQLSKKILEEGVPLNTLEIFTKICELLNLNKDTIADKIGDYYTSLTTDKSFILLDSGKWDLQEKHPATISLEEEEEDPALEEEEEEAMEEIVDDIDNIDDALVDDDIDDDIDDDLTIIPDDELDEENM